MFPAVKLIYKPIGIILGLSSGLVAKRLFNLVWEKLDDEDPPKATTELVPLRKVFAAAAIQGVVFKTVRVLVDRAGARGFQHLTGTWPGPKVPDPE
jgi:hypothetical protein